jgi:hypothetical protein
VPRLIVSIAARSVPLNSRVGVYQYHSDVCGEA